MKNLSRYLTVVGVATAALGGCAGGAADKSGAERATKGTDFKTCAVSDTGSWDSKSFNGSAYEGLETTKDDLDVKINTAESLSNADFVPNVEAMIDDGYDLVIGVGFKIEKALRRSAEANTDIGHTLVDSSFSDADFNTIIVENDRPPLFNTADAAFLASYVVTGMTKTGKVATLGGIQIPSVPVFIGGFVDGVAAYNEAKGTDVQLLGWGRATQNDSFAQSFDDQALGKQQAQRFIDQGADIVVPIAGPAGLGAAATARENDSILIIGVGFDWYDANPDYSSIILTSVMRQIGASVEQTIEDSIEGKFPSEPYIGSLVNGGVSLAPLHNFDAQIPQELGDEVERLNGQIKSGKLKIESQDSPK